MTINRITETQNWLPKKRFSEAQSECYRAKFTNGGLKSTPKGEKCTLSNNKSNNRDPKLASKGQIRISEAYN